MAVGRQDASSVVRWICSLLLLLSATPSSLAGEPSCFELGFTPNLLCSSCRELKRFSLQPLEEECHKCCQAVGEIDEKVLQSTGP